jgi:hypothetical protein
MHIVIRSHGDFDIDVCIDHDVEAGAEESTDTGHGSIETTSTTKRTMSSTDIAVSGKKDMYMEYYYISKCCT